MKISGLIFRNKSHQLKNQTFKALSGTISAALASVWIPKILRKMHSVKAEAFVSLGLAGTLLLMGLSWATSPIWSVFLTMLFLNCFFTQCSRILLTELTAQRAPKEQRGTVMGTVTSLTGKLEIYLAPVTTTWRNLILAC